MFPLYSSHLVTAFCTPRHRDRLPGQIVSSLSWHRSLLVGVMTMLSDLALDLGSYMHQNIGDGAQDRLVCSALEHFHASDAHQRHINLSPDNEAALLPLLHARACSPLATKISLKSQLRKPENRRSG